MKKTNPSNDLSSGVNLIQTLPTPGTKSSYGRAFSNPSAVYKTLAVKSGTGRPRQADQTVTSGQHSTIISPGDGAGVGGYSFGAVGSLSNEGNSSCVKESQMTKGGNVAANQVDFSFDASVGTKQDGAQGAAG